MHVPAHVTVRIEYNHNSTTLHGQRGIAGSLERTMQLSGAAEGNHVQRRTRFTLWLRCIMSMHVQYISHDPLHLVAPFSVATVSVFTLDLGFFGRLGVLVSVFLKQAQI